MISLIIRTVNNEKFIEKSVKSAIDQDFKDYEIIVINDGSTDNTRNILESFSNDKLRIIHQENKGMIEAGYSGLRQSRGKYIIFLDGDDEYDINALSELYQAIQKDKNYAFSYCDYREVDLRTGDIKTVSCKNIFNVLACGILFKKSVLDELGFWDRNFIFAEHDLLLRIMAKYKGVHVPKPLYIYNRHEKSFTADKKKVEEGKKQLFAKYGFIEGFKEY